MESKNLNPRIIAALRAIGEPATARDIADIGMIEEPIHARMREMVEHGRVIGTKTLGEPMLYALPEWQHQDGPAAEEPAMVETTLVATPTDKPESPEPTPKTPQYTTVLNMLRKQKQITDDVISKYVCRMLDDDPIYQRMVENRNLVSMIMREIETERLI